MNREVEFRAWQYDGEYSRMIYSIQGVLTALRHTLGEASAPSFSDCNNQLDKNRFSLMQYTGLVDDSGTKVYEGDFLWFHVIIKGEKYNDFGMVKFSNYEWMVESIHGDLDCLSDWADFPIAVVGNIFENPELLEEAE